MDFRTLVLFLCILFLHLRLSLSSNYTCFDVDPNDLLVCSSHGQCVGMDTCVCDRFYGDPSTGCVDPICFGLLASHPFVCSGHGDCFEPLRCICEAGFHGKYCERSFTCFGKENFDGEACSGSFGRGLCVAKIGYYGGTQCRCEAGYFGNECEDSVCYGEWGAYRCGGSERGLCKDVDVCDCFESRSSILPFEFFDELFRECVGIWVSGVREASNSSLLSVPTGSMILWESRMDTYVRLDGGLIYWCNASNPSDSRGHTTISLVVYDQNATLLVGLMFDVICDAHFRSSTVGELRDWNGILVSNASLLNGSVNVGMRNILRSGSYYVGFFLSSSPVTVGESFTFLVDGDSDDVSLQHWLHFDPSSSTLPPQLQVESGVISLNGLVAETRLRRRPFSSLIGRSVFGCWGLLSSHPDTCSGNGICVGTDLCECDSGFFDEACSSFFCRGIEHRDEAVCLGHGRCLTVDVCECDIGYFGYNCNIGPSFKELFFSALASFVAFVTVCLCIFVGISCVLLVHLSGKARAEEDEWAKRQAIIELENEEEVQRREEMEIRAYRPFDGPVDLDISFSPHARLEDSENSHVVRSDDEDGFNEGPFLRTPLRPIQTTSDSESSRSDESDESSEDFSHVKRALDLN